MSCQPTESSRNSSVLNAAGLALLIKIGGPSGINYIGLTARICGIAKRSGTDQHGPLLQMEKRQEKLIIFFFPLIFRIL